MTNPESCSHKPKYTREMASNGQFFWIPEPSCQLCEIEQLRQENGLLHRALGLGRTDLTDEALGKQIRALAAEQNATPGATAPGEDSAARESLRPQGLLTNPKLLASWRREISDAIAESERGMQAGLATVRLPRWLVENMVKLIDSPVERLWMALERIRQMGCLIDGRKGANCDCAVCIARRTLSDDYCCPAPEPSEQPAPEDRNWQNGFRAGKASLPRFEFNQHCGECQRNKITVEVFCPEVASAERAFFAKHALGALARPSCLVCGQPPQEWPPGIQHAELPEIVVCTRCRDAGQRAAQKSTAEPPLREPQPDDYWTCGMRDYPAYKAAHDEWKRRCALRTSKE